MAIRSFLILITAILAPIFLIAFMLKQTALNSKYAPHNSSIMKESFYPIAYQAGSGEEPANSWEAINNTIKHSDKFWVWLDINRSKDGSLLLYGSDFLQEFTEKKGHILFHTFSELQKLNAGHNFKDSSGEKPYLNKQVKIHTLKETLINFPKTRFILNVISNTPLVDTRILEITKETKSENRVIFTSPFNIVLKSLRKNSPLSIYGMHSAEITRLIMFGAFTLEPTIPLKGDLLISYSKRIKKQLTPSFVKEVNRRFKKVILGPVNSSDDFEKLKLDFSPSKLQGFITKFPSNFGSP